MALKRPFKALFFARHIYSYANTPLRSIIVFSSSILVLICMAVIAKPIKTCNPHKLYANATITRRSYSAFLDRGRSVLRPENRLTLCAVCQRSKERRIEWPERRGEGPVAGTCPRATVITWCGSPTGTRAAANGRVRTTVRIRFAELACVSTSCTPGLAHAVYDIWSRCAMEICLPFTAWYVRQGTDFRCHL